MTIVTNGPMTLDPYDSGFQSDPYPTYARLRDEAPALRLQEPDVWLLSRHADVDAALRDPGTYSSAYGVAFGRSGGQGALIATDPPDHGRLRKLLARQFSPRQVAALEHEIRSTAVLLLEQVHGQKHLDLVDVFAAPLPTRVVASYLGVDPERWRDYKRWSDVLNDLSWAKNPSERTGAAMFAVGLEAHGFFTSEIQARRTEPRDDLIGRLVSAVDEDALTDDEVISFCTLLMLAGNVTTTSLLSYGLQTLLQHPEQLALLRDDPSLIPGAIEEMLRFESPIQGFVRTLTRDVDLHGQHLAAGEQVMLLFGSANRDDRAFTDPERFDVRRDSSAQVAFGAGPHFCLGAWLARLEARVALEELLIRTVRLAPAAGAAPRRVASPAFRELETLPLDVTWSASTPRGPAARTQPRAWPSARSAAGHGLTSADELLCHQTVDTFATVSQSDLAWTEKVWGVATRRDGALQIDAGMGRYHNRGVVDGFGGISRGREQWTVRASRDLWSDPEAMQAGPLRYEVLEPLRAVRFTLDPSSAVNVSYDLVFEATMPAVLEERDRKRDSAGLRTASDTLRYHQCTSVRGWVEVQGERLKLVPEEWFGVRDHSWGVRHGVGTPPAGVRSGPDPATLPILFSWSPLLFTRPDGSQYELHHYVQQLGEAVFFSSGHLLQPDGSVQQVAVRPDLRFHPVTRRLLGGTLHLTTPDGGTRPIDVEVVGDTGFHLGQGLYLGLDGYHHGDWRGSLRVDGEHVPDCADPTAVRRIHQLRDCVVRAVDGDAVGVGVHETLVGGGWPELGLTGDDAFL